MWQNAIGNVAARSLLALAVDQTVAMCACTLLAVIAVGAVSCVAAVCVRFVGANVVDMTTTAVLAIHADVGVGGLGGLCSWRRVHWC